MIRNKAWTVASHLMAAAVVFSTWTVGAENPGAAASGSSPAVTVRAGVTTLVPSSEHTVLQYDLSL